LFLENKSSCCPAKEEEEEEKEEVEGEEIQPASCFWQEPIGDLFLLLSFSCKRMIVSYSSLDFCFYKELQSNGRIK
jgi:hypothetical protein